MSQVGGPPHLAEPFRIDRPASRPTQWNQLSILSRTIVSPYFPQTAVFRHRVIAHGGYQGSNNDEECVSTRLGMSGMMNCRETMSRMSGINRSIARVSIGIAFRSSIVSLPRGPRFISKSQPVARIMSIMGTGSE